MLSITVKDLKELANKFKSASPMTQIILIVVIVVVLFEFRSMFDFFLAKTNYAPQSVGDNSSGNIQVQGNGNKVNTPPPFKLEYKILEEKQKENMEYLTVFEVKVIRPGGNFQKGFNILYDQKKEECSAKWTGSESMENNGRQIFETQIGTMKCISRDPIIDNGNLFSVKGVD